MSNWKAGDKALCVDDLEAPELKAGRTYLVLAVSYWGGLSWTLTRTDTLRADLNWRPPNDRPNHILGHRPCHPVRRRVHRHWQ